jgi:small subunit ribosomal protein S2
VADSYNEGAKEYEAKLRTLGDKADKEDVVAKPAKEKDEAPRRRGARPDPKAEAKKSGPAIVKASKTRKLVAAGTADDVEIQQELEEGEKSETETTEE